MSKVMNPTSTATVDKEISTSSSVRPLRLVGNSGKIPDGIGSFQDSIVVKDNFKINNITVTLTNLEHTWVGDVVARLSHVETGTAVDLFRRPGKPQFSSSGYSSDLNGNYSFNDDFTGNFDRAAATNDVIPSGEYAAVEALSVFKGLSSSGMWELLINDCSAGDSGCLGSWSLELA